MEKEIKITETDSTYRHLEKMSVSELLININIEDAVVPAAITKVLPAIGNLVEAITDKLLLGGRLFYIGAGTSGRLAVVDASECPPFLKYMQYHCFFHKAQWLHPLNRV